MPRKSKTVDNYWKRINFSDEMTEILKPGGEVKVWRQSCERLRPKCLGYLSVIYVASVVIGGRVVDLQRFSPKLLESNSLCWNVFSSFAKGIWFFPDSPLSSIIPELMTLIKAK